MEDKTKLLYDKLSEQGLYTKSFDEFTTQFSDPSKRELLHSALGKQGLYTKTFDEFNAQFFPVEKKKDTSESDGLPSSDIPSKIGQEVSKKPLEDFTTQPSQSTSTEQPSVLGELGLTLETPKPTGFHEENIGTRGLQYLSGQTPDVIGNELTRKQKQLENIPSTELKNSDGTIKLATPKSLVEDYFNFKSIPRDNSQANTAGEAVMSVPKELSNAFGRMFDDMATAGRAVEKGFAQIFLGKKGSDAYMKAKDAGTFSAPNSMSARPAESLSTFLSESTKNLKYMPEGLGGSVAKGMIDIVPDIAATLIFPEGKVFSIAPKIGLNLGKFGMEQAIRGYAQGIGESNGQFGLQLKMPVVRAIEKGAMGWMYETAGGLNQKFAGNIANRLFPNASTVSESINKSLLEHGTVSTLDGLTFGGLGSLDELLRTGKITSKTFLEGFGMGVGFHAVNGFQLLGARAYTTLLGMPSEGITRLATSGTSAEELNKQADEKINLIETKQSQNPEGDAVMAFMLKKTAQAKAMAEEVLTNKDEVIADIKANVTDKKAQEVLTDKINEVDADNDPKVQATKEINDKIAKIDEQLETIKSNKSWDDARKEVESAPLKEQKQALKDEAIATLNKPIETEFKLGDKSFKTEKELTDWLDKNYNEEDRFTSVNEDGYLEPNTMKVFNKWYKENKPRLAQEHLDKIEQSRPPKDVTFIGKQEGETPEESLDLYNVKVGGQEATFAVPSGSGRDVIEAKKQATIDKFKPAESKESIPLVEEKTDGSTGDKVSYLTDEQATRIGEKLGLTKEQVLADSPSNIDFVYDPKNKVYPIVKAIIDEIGKKPKSSLEESKPILEENNNSSGDSKPSLTDNKVEEVLSKGDEIKAKQEVVKGKIADNLDNLMSAIGGIKNITGDQRVKVLSELADLAKNIAELTSLKGEQLWNEVKKYLDERKITLPDDLISESKTSIIDTYKEKTTEKGSEVSAEEKISEKSSGDKKNANNPDVRQMEVARKAVDESMLLSDDTKQDLRDQGIEYAVQKDSALDSEVEEMVKIYGKDVAGLDQMQALITKEDNKLSGDRRNWLTALLIKERAKQIEIAPDFASKVAEKKKLTDLIIFASNKGVFSGRETRSFKKIGEALELYPEAIKASVIAKIDQKNKEFFDGNGLEKMIKEEVANFFKDKPQSKPQEDIPDIDVSKAKLARVQADRKEILAKLKESFKKPSGTLSSSVIPLSAEQVELVVKLVGNYIEEGALRTEKVVRKLRKDWEEITGEKITDEDALKLLPKEVNGRTIEQWDAEGRKPRVEKQGKPPRKLSTKSKPTPTEEELTNRLLKKAGKIATKKQLENFVKKYLTEIANKGLLTDQEFRSVLAEALGKDYVSGQSEGKIDEAAKAVSKSNEKLGLLQKAFDDWKTEYNNDPKSPKLADLRKALDSAIKDADNAMSDAKRKYQFVQSMLQEEPDFVSKLGTMIQGGLLIPSSQVANILGNVALLPETGPAYMLSGAFDALTAKTGEGMQQLISKVDPVKHPWLYRKLNAWTPSDKRTILPGEYAKGYARGFGHNFLEGVKQTFSVEGPVGTELMKGSVQRGVHPIDAFMHLYKTATKEEQRTLQQLAGDLMEALPAGYMANAQFRGLNMFDLPFRGAGESGILYEAFGIKRREQIKQANQITDKAEREKKLKYLEDTEDVAREEFYRNPDKTTLELAKRQGAKGTFSQNTALSNAINSFERFAKDQSGSVAETAVNTGLRMLKMLNMPYVTVPINIMGKSLEMSIPIFPAYKMINHIAKAGMAKEKGHYAVADSYRRMAMEDFGNAIVAGAVTTLATSLAMAGVIRGNSDDKDVKAAQQDIGKEGLRFNADAFRRWRNGEDPTWQDGDDTYSLRRLGVFSVQLGAIAQAIGEKTPEELEKMKNLGLIEKQAQIGANMLKYAPTIALEQSIMTGVNNMVQGLMGSEAEKDKWVVGMAGALSSAVYPNTMGNISQSLDGYYRETRDLSKDESKITAQLKNTFKDRMFGSDKLPTKVSIWGQKIRRIPEGENPVLYGILGIAKHKEYQQYSFGAELYDFYEKMKETNPDDAKNLFPTLPTARTEVGWDDAKMSPEQVQQYQERVGQLRAQEAETYFNSKEWDEADDEDKIAQLTRIYSKARKTAEAELFSWLGMKQSKPDDWKILVDNEALPIPVVTKKLGEHKLNNNDIKQYNDIALQFYADEVVPMLKDMTPDDIKEMKTPDPETGISPWTITMNKLWSASIRGAKGVYLESLSEK